MAKTHDRKVRPRTFKEGDMVLRKVISLPYEGPYIVKKAFSRRALIRTSMDREDVLGL